MLKATYDSIIHPLRFLSNFSSYSSCPYSAPASWAALLFCQPRHQSLAISVTSAYNTSLRFKCPCDFLSPFCLCSLRLTVKLCSSPRSTSTLHSLYTSHHCVTCYVISCVCICYLSPILLKYSFHVRIFFNLYHSLLFSHYLEQCLTHRRS